MLCFAQYMLYCPFSHGFIVNDLDEEDISDIDDEKQKKRRKKREAVVRPVGGSHSRMRRRNTSTASTSTAPQTVVGYSNTSDLNGIHDIELVMQVVNQDQQLQSESSCRTRNAINRERDVARVRLMADYFGEHPKYLDYYFRRPYRMNYSLLLEIVQGIENYIETVNSLPGHFKFFVVRPDATGLMSFSIIMKCTSVIRQLAYNTSHDKLDEYLQMREHCACDCLDFFTMCIIDLFTAEFLRKPDVNDIQTLYATHNSVDGLPRMLGSIGCMHWEWINCLKAWHRQFGR
ncbi:ALP1-like protein, partial [Tanacetum coccineum]